MKEKLVKKVEKIFQIKNKISTMPSQNIFQARFWKVNYIFQDPQGSFQIEFHKNKYNFGKKMFIQQ